MYQNKYGNVVFDHKEVSEIQDLMYRLYIYADKEDCASELTKQSHFYAEILSIFTERNEINEKH